MKYLKAAKVYIWANRVRNEDVRKELNILQEKEIDRQRDKGVLCP